jgi:DNA polymerase III subunit delta
VEVSELRDQIRRGDFSPVYLLYGRETYLRDLAVKTLVSRAFAEGDFRDFNDTTFSLNTQGNLKEALTSARQLPMMSSRRVIRITDVRISQSGFRDTITEADEPVLTDYLASPEAATIVIFVADELNKVRKMGKLLVTKTAAVDFEPLRGPALADWARKHLADAGVAIDPAAFQFLLARVGDNVARLANEINKLAAAAMPSGQITNEMIDALVPDTSAVDNFEFVNEIIVGRPGRGLALLRKTLDDGAEPLALIGAMAFKYRTLLTVKAMMQRGADEREVKNAVRMPYGTQAPFIAAARRADIRVIQNALKRLAETDLAIKTSQGGSGPKGARLQIEMLACELALA